MGVSTLAGGAHGSVTSLWPTIQFSLLLLEREPVMVQDRHLLVVHLHGRTGEMSCSSVHELPDVCLLDISNLTAAVAGLEPPELCVGWSVGAAPLPVAFSAEQDGDN